MKYFLQLAQPHKSYLPEIRLLRERKIPFKGLVHVTGGGLIDNPPRILPDDQKLRFHFFRDIIDTNMPEMFKWLWKQTGIDRKDYMQFYRFV